MICARPPTLGDTIGCLLIRISAKSASFVDLNREGFMHVVYSNFFEMMYRNKTLILYLDFPLYIQLGYRYI